MKKCIRIPDYSEHLLSNPESLSTGQWNPGEDYGSPLASSERHRCPHAKASGRPLKAAPALFCSSTIRKKRCNHRSTIRQILWSAIPPSLSSCMPIKRNTSARWGMGKHQAFDCSPWPHPYEADHALSLSIPISAHLWRLALVRAIWNTSKQFRR